MTEENKKIIIDGKEYNEEETYKFDGEYFLICKKCGGCETCGICCCENVKSGYGGYCNGCY